MTTPDTERKSRSEHARAARREEILTAARAVFARQGFRGTTIADIAEEAGIALGTIYLYFRSKEDVFAALSERLAEIIVRALVDVQEARSMEESVRSRVTNVFDACAENRDLIRLVVLNTDRDSTVAQRMRAAEEKRALPMVRAIAAGIEAGFVRPGDPVIMTKLTHGAVTMAVYQAFVLNDGRDWQAYRDACCDMLVAYLTPPRQAERGTEGAGEA